MKKLLLLPLVAMSINASDDFFSNDYTQKRAEAKYKLSYDVGIRADELVWNKGKADYLHTDNIVYHPNILSELTWSDVHTIYHRFNLRGDEGKYALKASYGFGTAYEGDNQDSDYLYDNRNGEFSRSNNNAVDSYMRDFSIALGQKYKPFSNTDMIFYIGYSHHLQDMKIKDGYQTIPATGSFSGLDSKYEAVWKGPFIGLDFEILKDNTFSFDLGSKLHYFKYEATGTWNLRNQLMQPDSFKHTGDGGGVSLNATTKYKFTNNWYFSLKYDFSYFKITDGIDTMYMSDGTVGKAILNEVTLKSHYASIGVEYKF